MVHVEKKLFALETWRPSYLMLCYFLVFFHQVPLEPKCHLLEDESKGTEKTSERGQIQSEQ
jgi:hypothetical protein